MIFSPTMIRGLSPGYYTGTTLVCTNGILPLFLAKIEHHNFRLSFIEYRLKRLKQKKNNPCLFRTSYKLNIFQTLIIPTDH